MGNSEWSELWAGIEEHHFSIIQGLKSNQDNQDNQDCDYSSYSSCIIEYTIVSINLISSSDLIST